MDRYLGRYARIVIVDDDCPNLELLERMLEQEGYTRPVGVATLMPSPAPAGRPERSG